VTAVGLPAVYVPLPIGNGEQRLNALPVIKAGGGMLIADAELTPGFVAEQVAGLLTDEARLTAMTAAAVLVGHPEAARQVARVALDVALQARDGKHASKRRGALDARRGIKRRSALEVARAAREARRGKKRRNALEVSRLERRR
jgi:UDP-N-acetylglucosamine--N-acetylmuramyl-(pentapeptide) pyrophosphoryl-undecaprenol N-acetylglucosamine transferase